MRLLPGQWLLLLLRLGHGLAQELQNILRLYTDNACTQNFNGANSQQTWDIPLVTGVAPHCVTFTSNEYCATPDDLSATCSRRLACGFESRNGIILQKRAGTLCTGDTTEQEAFYNHLDWSQLVQFLSGTCVAHADAGIWMKFESAWRSSPQELLYPNCSAYAFGGSAAAGRVAPGTYVLQLYTDPACQIASIAGFTTSSGASRFLWKEMSTGCFRFLDQTPRSEDLLNSDSWRAGALDLEHFKLVCDMTSSGFTVERYSTDDTTCTGPVQRSDTFFWETCYPDMLSLFRGECIEVGSAFSSWWAQGWLKFDKAWPDNVLADCTGPNQLVPACPSDTEQVVIQVNYDTHGRWRGNLRTSRTSRQRPLWMVMQAIAAASACIHIGHLVDFIAM